MGNRDVLKHSDISEHVYVYHNQTVVVSVSTKPQYSLHYSKREMYSMVSLNFYWIWLHNRTISVHWNVWHVWLWVHVFPCTQNVFKKFIIQIFIPEWHKKLNLTILMLPSALILLRTIQSFFGNGPIFIKSNCHSHLTKVFQKKAKFLENKFEE